MQLVVQNVPITIKEAFGQRIVTFSDIDAVHGRPEGTARKRFNDNRKHFVAGVDYVKVKAATYRKKYPDFLPGAFGEVIVITETGYLLLVKSFTDDLAWEVQKELIHGYFRSRLDGPPGTQAELPDQSQLDADRLIQCAEIMAGCVESNRPYVLSILRKVIPDIDQVMEGKTHPAIAPSKSGLVTIDPVKFKNLMKKKDVTADDVSRVSRIPVHVIYQWIIGQGKPTSEELDRVCNILGCTVKEVTK